MGHPKELLEAILSQVLRSYPERKGFSYIMEQRLRISDKNIQPDIQVLRGDGSVVCVVEIGYTRPEKLRTYRELEIPDIRWLDKQGEPVNPFDKTRTRTITKVEWRPQPTEVWRHVMLCDPVLCDDCFSEQIEYFETEDGKDHDEAVDEAMEEYWKEADTSAQFWSNGIRGFVLVYCDLCGGNFLNTPCDADLDLVAFNDDRWNYDHDLFLAEYYRQRRKALDSNTPRPPDWDQFTPLGHKILLYDEFTFPELRELVELRGIKLSYDSIQRFGHGHDIGRRDYA